MKSQYIDCDCGSADHVIRFVLTEDEIPELYIEMQMHQYRNMLQRIWEALRYIFKCKSRYGYWDVCMIDREGATKLAKILKEFQSKQPKM